MAFVPIIMTIALQSASPPCDILDAALLTEPQSDCLASLTEDILERHPVPLTPGRTDIRLEAIRPTTDTCSFHGRYLEPVWPTRADGSMIEIDAPVRVETRYAWQADGTTGDIGVAMIEPSGLPAADAALFEASTWQAIATYMRPTACISDAGSVHRSVMIFTMGD